MEVFPGKRDNSHLYVYEDYAYHLDKRCGETYRCTIRKSMKCPGMLTKHGDTFNLKKQHNHPPQSLLARTMKLKSAMRDMTLQSSVRNKDIFDAVSRQDENAAVHITYKSMKSSLSREKLKRMPQVPNNLQMLKDTLRTYKPLQKYYKGSAESSRGEIALLFSTDKLLKALSDMSEIFVDGTFSVLPRTPHIAQLYTVHMRYLDTGVATIFILCQCRTATLYEAIWDKIFQLVPGLRDNIKFIMADYEVAAVKTMKEKFPAASLHGCWFHYTQAVLRKWRKLNLRTAPRDILLMSMTLALAPKSFFEEAFGIMQCVADEVSDSYPDILVFMAYMRRTWLPLASEVSVYKCPSRTNNIVESFHNTTALKMGTIRPNVWIFLENITKLLTDQELNFGRLKLGHRITRARTRYNKEKDAKIVRAQEDLIAGKIRLKEFLSLFHHFHDQIQYQHQIICTDDVNNQGTSVDLPSTTQIETGGDECFEHQDIRIGRENISEEPSAGKEVDPLDDEDVDDQLKNLSLSFEGGDECSGHQEIRFGRENISEGPSAGKEVDPLDEEDVYDQLKNLSLSFEDTAHGTCKDDSYTLIQFENSLDNIDVPYRLIKPIKYTDKERKQGSCAICLVRQANIVFFPCSHLCSCDECVVNIQRKVCPICNNNYDFCKQIIIC